MPYYKAVARMLGIELAYEETGCHVILNKQVSIDDIRDWIFQGKVEWQNPEDPHCGLAEAGEPVLYYIRILRNGYWDGYWEADCAVDVDNQLFYIS